MLAKNLKPGVKLGPTLTVKEVTRDGEVVGVRYEEGGYAEYLASHEVGGDE